MKVVGVDGCRAGWKIAVSHMHDATMNIEVHPSIQSIYKAHPDVGCVAIDMIIGLPATAQKGGRSADQQARRILGKRGSVVFSAPCRPAIYANDYPTALEISRRSTPASIGLSKQTWHLGTKIRELDQFLRQELNATQKTFEVHPELAFFALNGSSDLLPSKHSTEGLALRRKLLIKAGMQKEIVNAGDDDALDAMACLWSAKRIANDESHRVPKTMIFDEMGLNMAIHW